MVKTVTNCDLDKKGFFIGIADLYVMMEGEAGHRRVGALDNVTLDDNVEALIVKCGSPAQPILRFPDEQEVSMSVELREVVAANLDLMLGSGVTVGLAVPDMPLFAQYDKGDSTIVLTGDQTLIFEAGQLYFIKDTLKQQLILVNAVNLVGANTEITVATGGEPLNTYMLVNTPVLYRPAYEKVGSGGSTESKTADAVFTFTRMDGEAWAIFVPRLAVGGGLSLSFANRQENVIPAKWTLLADEDQEAGEQLYTIWRIPTA